MKLLKFFLIFTIYNFDHIVFSNGWKNQLTDYDIISKITIRQTRSNDINRKLYFKSKYRNFHLILKPTDSLFTNDFQSSYVDKYGRKTPIFVDRSHFYEGFVSGSHQSSVRAFLGTDEDININIAMDNEIYQIESLSRYEESNSSLIIYRFSDLQSNHFKGPLCPSSNLSLSSSNYSEIRTKRFVGGINSGDKMGKFCTIRLVADFLFYREHGKGDAARTTNYLIELMDSINQLFKMTEFTDSNNNKYIGYGFLIKDIVVHTEWTVNIPGHYNEFKKDGPDAWKCEDLLNSFGADNFNDVCLSHLFTYQSFTEGTLGLGWIGTWKYMNHGGICSERVFGGYRGMKSVNAAWSTYKDAANNHLISLSAYLVTAHELGHNWGADHDPGSDECSPNANGGGKYVMYTYSVVGYEMNNRLFSPCSKRSIGETISARGKTCFTSASTNTFCGNLRVEKSEQCDVVNRNNNDRCCSETCQFRNGAKCSPENHECCTMDCQIKPRGEICANADPLNPCLGNAICDGVNRTCLPPELLTGPKCTEHGKCVNGRCTPFCETINLQACICDKLEETCDICCRDTKSINKECQPVSRFLSDTSVQYKLNEGRPCSQGVCVQGACKRKVNKLIERIWKMIDNLDTNLFAAFMLDNLVGTVIIFSLLLWVPASIVVSCHDARYRKLILAERNIRRQQITPLANL